MKFVLQFPEDEIETWAARYSDYYDDSHVEVVGSAARSAGWLTRDQFLGVAEWKTPRSKSRCRRNVESYVRAVTDAALLSDEPRFKIEVLRILDGVDWPTASVILHFCDADRWPIIDYRAYWSLGQPAPNDHYSYALWDSYVKFARLTADRLDISMRQLDRALWAYEGNQPVAGGTLD